MKNFVLTAAVTLLTLSSAMADVTLTINNKDFPTTSACRGDGQTVVKLSEGTKYDLKLASDCSVVVKKIQ